MLFEDRRDAGRQLAARLAALQKEGSLDLRNAVVLALPRGGVPPAFEIASALQLPLDVCVVRKVGAPGQPELAVAAVSEGGEMAVNEGLRSYLGIADAELAALAAPKHLEVKERMQRFRQGRAPVPVRGKTVILVDDGLATGATALGAIHVIRKLKPAAIVLALPVCPASAVAKFSAETDAMVTLQTPADLIAVGYWYRDFSQVDDQEVKHLLLQADALQRERDTQ